MATALANSLPPLPNTQRQTHPIPNQTPNPFHTVPAPASLQSITSLKQAKQIHASILRNGRSELELYAKLFVLCTSPPIASTGGLAYAALVFDKLEIEPNVFMYNTLIRGFSNSELAPKQAISLYNRMRCSGLQPNNYTFTFLVKACTDDPSSFSGPFNMGRAIHAQITVFGIPDSDVYIHTSLINMYGIGGDVEAARKVFDRMPQRTSVTWNAMVAGYSKMGDVESARKLFDEMPERDEQSWNVLVCGYARIGECGVAGRLFDEMPVKTLPTWNAMIAGYTRASRPMEALGIFHQMQIAGVEPDEITVVTVLPACAQLGALELGEWVRDYIEKKRFDCNVTVHNALIDMYAKCGCIDKAMDVFYRMRERSVVSWNTIISGLAIHGHGKEAIELFVEMESEGVAPDDITFVGLLSACGHAGFVERAQLYFESMSRFYGIQPKIEHYGCMVDVLCRAQFLDEALGLIDSMPFKPNSVILGSLLSACRTFNNFQLGERVLKKLVEIEPQNPGYYVLLSNMYACTGQWEEVMGIRGFMKLRGIKKTPGCSSIEVDNMVHEFVVGDKTHPKTQEIYTKLDEISHKLKMAGYVADTSMVLFDLDEDEKAQNLSLHSEKLAVAFGLLSVTPRKIIRVVKNLRVCKDCHFAIKLISYVYDREIILRDRNRFHHFKKGLCSCNDYW